MHIMHQSQIINYEISTSAISGEVSTQFYGEAYQPHLVPQNIKYQVFIYPPENMRNNSNVTLNFKIEKISLTEMTTGADNILIENDGVASKVESGVKSVSFNFTPPTGFGSYDFNRWMGLSRGGIPKEELNTMDMNVMPGFKFSWSYQGLSEEVTPLPEHKFLGESSSRTRHDVPANLFIEQVSQ